MPGIIWPALPDRTASQILAAIQQLNHSQWIGNSELRQLQHDNLRLLLQHAIDTVPFYIRLYSDVGVTEKTPWEQLPIISRLQIQDAGKAMFSLSPPKSHGSINTVETSGTSGAPLRLLSSSVTKFMWMAFTLREHLWRQRDFSKKLAVIRPDEEDAYQQHVEHHNWGFPVSLIYQTGSMAYTDSMQPADILLKWLCKQKPAYLLTMPTVLREMLYQSERTGLRPKGLMEVRTLGEIVNQELRDFCFQVWKVPIVDIFSSRELGYIALQCPKTDNYHIQAESLFTEVLNEQGQVCQAGETGRLVVTALHNFASPLIRYETMDYVEVAGQCECGRGLPTISKILGRERNFLVHPDGRKYLPTFQTEKWMGLAPIKQIQFVQKSVLLLEVRILPARQFTESEEQNLKTVLCEVFDAPFDIVFNYVDEPLRHSNGKFEDFRCDFKP